MHPADPDVRPQPLFRFAPRPRSGSIDPVGGLSELWARLPEGGSHETGNLRLCCGVGSCHTLSCDPASPPVKNIILKSEEGADVSTIRMSETATDPSWASAAAFESGETAVSVLDGFKVTESTVDSVWAAPQGKEN